MAANSKNAHMAWREEWRFWTSQSEKVQFNEKESWTSKAKYSKGAKTSKWLQYVNLKNLRKNRQIASVCEFEKSMKKPANGFSM